MPKFRKKPVVVSAEQFFLEMEVWPSSVYNVGSYTYIRTLEGVMRVSPGDWIITGVRGEKYSCKPDIFELTYELVPEAHSDPLGSKAHSSSSTREREEEEDAEEPQDDS